MFTTVEDSLVGPPLPAGLALSSLMLGGGRYNMEPSICCRILYHIEHSSTSGITSNLSPYSPMPSQFHLHSQQWQVID